jgi:nucleotide-binding universal stress UspA family protein
MEKPKVIVALRDAESIEGLVELACEMAGRLGADLVALHVVEVGPGLPLDADGMVDRLGKQVLTCAQQVAESLGKGVHTLLVRARRAGPVIVGQAEAHKAELLILGYHGPHGLGEILFGSTARYVAQHAPCRVIIQVPPVCSREAVEVLTRASNLSTAAKLVPA